MHARGHCGYQQSIHICENIVVGTTRPFVTRGRDALERGEAGKRTTCPQRFALACRGIRCCPQGANIVSTVSTTTYGCYISCAPTPLRVLFPTRQRSVASCESATRGELQSRHATDRV